MPLLGLSIVITNLFHLSYRGYVNTCNLFFSSRFDKHRLQQVTCLYKAIGLSIDSLDAACKEYYHDFALFMDDVNIRSEVKNIVNGCGENKTIQE